MSRLAMLDATHLRYIWCPAQAHFPACRNCPKSKSRAAASRRSSPAARSAASRCASRACAGRCRATCSRSPAAPCARSAAAASTCWSIAATVISSCIWACRAACACCRRTRPPGKHDHFDLLLGDRVLRLRDPRRFGAVLWAAGDVDAHPLLAHLGIEPLSRALDAGAAARAHARRIAPRSSSS